MTTSKLLLVNAGLGAFYYNIAPKFPLLSKIPLETQMKVFGLTTLIQAVSKYFFSFKEGELSLKEKTFEVLTPYLVIGVSNFYFNRQTFKANIASTLILGTLQLTASYIIVPERQQNLSKHTQKDEYKKPEQIDPSNLSQIEKEKLSTIYKNKIVGTTVWIGDEKDKVQLGKILGSGGSKHAVIISEESVLMFPKTDLATWHRMVNEEVTVSEKLSELGILNVQSRKVSIFLSADDGEKPFVAYVCPSFEHLAEQGIFVIDGKNPQSTTLKHPLFSGNDDRYSMENWIPIVTPLLSDIFVLAKHNLLFGPDSQNVAVVKGKEGETTTYKARYFGFDFSSKYFVMNQNFDYVEEDVTDRVKQVFKGCLELLFLTQAELDDDVEYVSVPERYRPLIAGFGKACPEMLRSIEESSLAT
ncbi:MAG: hypothetical protein KDK96_05945 [Chlamydiia bacterium]|nr:hypothetical protein [Chlamydiia bacterium]